MHRVMYFFHCIAHMVSSNRYAPINVLPHPPLGPKWGFTGGIDTKLLLHYGAFDDRLVAKHPNIFFCYNFLRYVKSRVNPALQLGLKVGI